MITTGWTQAHDELSALCKSLWDAGAESAGLLLLFEDDHRAVPESPKTGEPATTNGWSRLTLRPGVSPQRSLGDKNGKRCYETEGTGIWQLFTSPGDGQRLAHALGKICQDGLRGAVTSPGQVWVRSPRLNIIGRDGGWFRINVEFGFTYYEVE